MVAASRGWYLWGIGSHNIWSRKLNKFACQMRIKSSARGQRNFLPCRFSYLFPIPSSISVCTFPWLWQQAKKDLPQDETCNPKNKTKKKKNREMRGREVKTKEYANEEYPQMSLLRPSEKNQPTISGETRKNNQQMSTQRLSYKKCTIFLLCAQIKLKC